MSRWVGGYSVGWVDTAVGGWVQRSGQKAEHKTNAKHSPNSSVPHKQTVGEDHTAESESARGCTCAYGCHCSPTLPGPAVPVKSTSMVKVTASSALRTDADAKQPDEGWAPDTVRWRTFLSKPGGHATRIHRGWLEYTLSLPLTPTLTNHALPFTPSTSPHTERQSIGNSSTARRTPG